MRGSVLRESTAKFDIRVVNGTADSDDRTAEWPSPASEASAPTSIPFSSLSCRWRVRHRPDSYLFAISYLAGWQGCWADPDNSVFASTRGTRRFAVMASHLGAA